ncbi:hypothetical protein OG783_33735 (plasmid) [Streptomyces jietaisiensis]|uniref:hypothetical protein n=1 Tax=Streptomyces griseoaurantiacus TaxID=68213 RepID=UPI0032453EE4
MPLSTRRSERFAGLRHARAAGPRPGEEPAGAATCTSPPTCTGSGPLSARKIS